MSGLDDWEEVQDGADDWEEVGASPEAPSVGQSALMGAQQGVTMGFADELGGRIQQGADALAGLFGESPTEANAKLREEGFMGDIGPTSNSELYTESRNQNRDEYKAAEDANPGSYIAGNIAGGILPTIAMPQMGAAKGAGYLETMGKAALQGAAYGAGASEEEDALGIAGDAALGGAVGGLLGGGIKYGANKAGSAIRGAGEYINEQAPKLRKGFDAIGNYINPSKPKANIEELKAAAKALGVELTPGMQDGSEYISHLENTLSKSPSYLGRSVKANQEKVIEKLAEAGQGLTDDAANLSAYQLGEKFKSGLTAKVGERLDPLVSTFDDVAQSTKNIPLSERSLNAVKRNIENLDVYQMTGGEGKPGKYVQMLPRLKNADQVKTMMTLLNNDIYDAKGAEKQVLLQIKDKLSRLEGNSIMRGALAKAKEARLEGGDDIGMDLISELKGARKGYRELAQDLSGVSKDARLRGLGGPKGFLDELEGVPSEKIQDKFFNPENNRQLQFLKEKFPEEFDLLRQGKIKELADGSQQAGEFSTAKFIKEAKKVTPESQEILFPGQVDKLKSIETVQNSIPKNFNPPNSAGEQSWQNVLYSNVKDLPNYLLYKGAQGGKAVSEAANISNNVVAFAQKAPQVFGRYASVMQDAASRGPQAVAATHFILEQREPEYRETLRKLAEDPEGQNGP
jgi:hypothetical protein